MKCEIVKDLLTLYAENLCSEESSKEIEEHLAGCGECKKHLELYRQELNDAQNVTEEKKQADKRFLKPMKKIKSSMLRKRIVTIVLACILVVVLSAVGLLSYGEITHQTISFSVLADAVKIKSACKSLANGDASKIVDLLVVDYEDYYTAQGIFGEFETYLELAETQMEEAAAYYFEGKDITVRIEQIVPYINPDFPKDHYVLPDELRTTIEVGFYDGNALVYSLMFEENVSGQVSIWENVTLEEPIISGVVFEGSDTILKLTTSAIARQYNDMISGVEKEHMGGPLRMLVNREAEPTPEEMQRYNENTDTLLNMGWYMKRCDYQRVNFDEEQGLWYYSLWILYENQQDGTLCLTEQYFYRISNNLYVIPGENAKVIMSSGEVDETAKSLMEGLFE